MRVLYHNVELSDQELLSQLRRAEPGALEQIYVRYASNLLGFLLRLTGRRDLAEDIFQDTWCKLAEVAYRIDPASDLFGWLLRVARNDYYDHRRRFAHARVVALAETPGFELHASAVSMPDSTSAAREELMALEQALQALSDVDREILLLVGVEDLSHERAAAVLGIAEPAMRKRLSRARERLEQQLREKSELAHPMERSMP